MNSNNKGPNLNGPESVPLREFIKSFLIVVCVYDQDEKLIRKEEIDYGVKEHRVWLGKCTYWALSSGYVVETMSKEFFEKGQ